MRRFIWLALGAIATAALVVIALAVSGVTRSSASKTASSNPIASPVRSQPPTTKCAVEYPQQRIYVLFRAEGLNDVGSDCRSWAQKRGAAGEFWAPIPSNQTPGETTSNFTCSLKDAAGDATADVLDGSSDQSSGNRACAELTAAGWLSQ